MDTPGFKTILCPVDFGELSAHALQHANLLAGCGNAKVIAVYANWFEAPAYSTAGRVEELQRQYREAFVEAERSLRAFVDSTLGENAVNVETCVVEALPADSIRELACQYWCGADRDGDARPEWIQPLDARFGDRTDLAGEPGAAAYRARRSTRTGSAHLEPHRWHGGR